MSKYKNKKTGLVIEAVSSMAGDWVPFNFNIEKPVQQEQVQELEKEPEIIEENSEGTVGDTIPEGITKNDIMQELDAFGVKYDKRWNKQKLYDLMKEQGE